MAVPTVYNNLAKYLLDGNLDDFKSRDVIKEILSEQYRLMVSGSAALPVT